LIPLFFFPSQEGTTISRLIIGIVTVAEPLFQEGDG
jgi:hypothetical protein